MDIAVFVSGRGSNLKAILDSPKLKHIAEVKAVFSDKSNCPAFNLANQFSIPTYCIGKTDGSVKNEHLNNFLLSLKIDLVVLAGYLKLIPRDVVSSFKFKIINIHPALLPSFGGSGMYGANVHKAVFKSSAQVSGATVHFVDETYDTGKIIAQRCVDISGVNSYEDIAERVLKIEHIILPDVIEKLALKKVILEDGRIRIKY